MPHHFRERRFPFYIGISTLVLLIVFTLTGLFLWIIQKESATAAIRTADQLFDEVNEKVLERYQHALDAVAVLAGSAALMPSMATPPIDDGLSHPGLTFMLRALAHYEYLFSLYVGYGDGTFLQVIATRGKPEVMKAYEAPPATRFVVRAITIDQGGEKHETLRYLDASEAVITGVRKTKPAYHPADRPWYIQAQQTDTAVYTKPYIFNSSKIPGITCAEKLSTGDGVFGADITLERFQLSLQRQKVSENGLLFLFDPEGRLIAHPDATSLKIEKSGDTGKTTEDVRFPTVEESDDPKIKTLATAPPDIRAALFEKTVLVDIQGEPHLARLERMGDRLRFDQMLGSVAPLSDFTGHITRMQYRTAMFAGGVLVLVLPFVFWMSRKISRSLVLLEKESQKIQRFDFSESEPFDSMIKEIHAHIQAFGIMKATIRARTDALFITQKKLEKLVASGIALSAEDDMDKLLKMIFDAAKELSHADGGTLYIRDEADMLRFEIMRTASQETVRGDALGDAGESITAIPIYRSGDGIENVDRVESYVARTGETVVVDSAAEDRRFRLSDVCSLDEAAGTACQSFLTVPLKPREGKTIGIMQIYNARDAKTGAITGFDGEIVGFVEALAAQAAVALHNKRLLDEQRQLFDAFIQLIAGAIDAKSPYTGGHCARVPEVAMLLARAADRAATGPFAEFKLETDDQWREFKVAAWLHDCGKVTTPEYVVDKATKLETLYNRIHEIRMRFEVLLRDAEIEYYRKRLSGEFDEKNLKTDLAKTREKIHDDFAFVAECNVGGEFMADEKIERLHRIADIRWTRHLSDRIGISQDEADRKGRQLEPSLPVEEHLLMDKAEHVIPRLKSDPFDGNAYGFIMDVPNDLYNLGELYNLSIRKGTLTTEERFKINEHIIQTIMMLKKLPFPAYLRNVAEFAGAHHETMDGSGYPRRLKKDDMSLPARIMAVADIFEALTASDRPYKKPKSLSESLRIMSFMRDDRHIDPELFDLFLESGVYQTYADMFLDPRQIDAVDIRKYIRGGS